MTGQFAVYPHEHVQIVEHVGGSEFIVEPLFRVIVKRQLGHSAVSFTNCMALLVKYKCNSYTEKDLEV